MSFSGEFEGKHFEIRPGEIAPVVRAEEFEVRADELMTYAILTHEKSSRKVAMRSGMTTEDVDRMMTYLRWRNVDTDSNKVPSLRCLAIEAAKQGMLDRADTIGVYEKPNFLLRKDEDGEQVISAGNISATVEERAILAEKFPMLVKFIQDSRKLPPKTSDSERQMVADRVSEMFATMGKCEELGLLDPLTARMVPLAYSNFNRQGKLQDWDTYMEATVEEIFLLKFISLEYTNQRIEKALGIHKYSVEEMISRLAQKNGLAKDDPHKKIHLVVDALRMGIIS